MKRPFNFTYTLWKPSHFFTGLEIHTRDTTWRTFREGNTIFGVRLRMAGHESVRMDVWVQDDTEATSIERLCLRISRSYGFSDNLRPFVRLLKENGHTNNFRPLLYSRISCPESVFEIAVLSVLLQNTTITRTTQMLKSLLMTAGSTVEFDGIRLRAFFSPTGLTTIGEAALRTLCRVGYRAPTLQALGGYFRQSGDSLESVSSLQLVERLLEIRGIGPYSAAVIAHAVLRDPGAAGLDVWNTQLAAELFGLGSEATKDEVRARLSKHYPGFEGLALLYLTEAAYISSPVDPLVSSPSDARRRSHDQIG